MVSSSKVEIECEWSVWKARYDELRAENERLQRENGALARTYAVCEQMLRERTEQLNQADAEIQRLRALVTRHHRHINTGLCDYCGTAWQT